MAALACTECGQALDGAAGVDGRCAQCREAFAGKQRGAIHSGSQPSLLIAAGLAGVCTGAFFALGPWFLLRDTYVFHMFCGHGWVPYALVALFFVGLWTLLLKIPMLAREREAFALGLLPEDASGQIGPADAKQILTRISRVTPRQKSLMLIVRVRQALLRFNQLGTAEKLDDLLRYRAEADTAAIDAGYAAPKFIIWAIPVLGFVGTVLGISNGVSAFSTLIQNASDLDGLRESLKGVTYGLGQAFETTMIALCMSMILMFVMSIVQRREDRLLAELDDYCTEHLLHKVRAAEAPQSVQTELAALTQALKTLAGNWKDFQESQRAAIKPGVTRQQVSPAETGEKNA